MVDTGPELGFSMDGIAHLALAFRVASQHVLPFILSERAKGELAYRS